MSETRNNATTNGKPQFGPDQPASYCGKPGKSGPPKGNTNGAKHYLRCKIPGGKLPKELAYIENKRNAFRRELIDIVLQVKPDIDIGEGTEVGATILTACGWLENRMKIQRYIRVKGAELSNADLLKYHEQEAKAVERIEAAIKRIGLNIAPQTMDLKDYIETTAKRTDHNGDDGEDE